jgi:hypothetical protein
MIQHRESRQGQRILLEAPVDKQHANHNGLPEQLKSGEGTHSVTSGAADNNGTRRSLDSKPLTSATASDTMTSNMTSTGMSFEDTPVCVSKACWSANTTRKVTTPPPVRQHLLLETAITRQTIQWIVE